FILMICRNDKRAFFIAQSLYDLTEVISNLRNKQDERYIQFKKYSSIEEILICKRLKSIFLFIYKDD
ncbi:MAG: hypothetical protein ACO3B0_03450, partial [Chitinophagaceae bacterium]